MNRKQGTGFRLSEKARQLLRLLADEEGITMTAILEMSIRQIAKEKGITVDNEKQKTKKQKK